MSKASTFDTHWAGMVRRQPELANEQTKMTISVGEFRKIVKRLYLAGQLDERFLPKASPAVESVCRSIFDFLNPSVN